MSESSRDRHGYVPCDRCGLDCGMDAVIPNDKWALIAPDGGILCVWCIDELLAERGLKGVPVKLFFVGKASSSELCCDPTHLANVMVAQENVRRQRNGKNQLAYPETTGGKEG